ncbi:MAG: leucine-rich repeat domain-containing protein, partial [Planctomycetes bacterium]|nr:leucine-rich repeat domain-containing protein [Planctomycetota bacterium]
MRYRRRLRRTAVVLPACVFVLAFCIGYGDSEGGSDEGTSGADSGRDGQVYEARTFNSKLRLRVFAIVEEDGVEELKEVGGTPADEPLRIPRCARWWVEPLDDARTLEWQALAEEVRRADIPALDLPGDTADGHLAHLAGLKNLRELYLDWTDITDAGLAHLTGLKNLRELDLGYTKITDAGLAHLKGLKNLRVLYLAHTKITDAGLAHLKGLKSLRVLYLRATKITDAGLTHLTGM